jgi:hypothetical protein
MEGNTSETTSVELKLKVTDLDAIAVIVQTKAKELRLIQKSFQ